MIRARAVAFWILISIVILATLIAGIPELMTDGPESALVRLSRVGYPPYLLKILSTAKILAIPFLISARFPRLSEWAYAGYTFVFLGAAASHILAGDSEHVFGPLSLFVPLMGAYFLRPQKSLGC